MIANRISNRVKTAAVYQILSGLTGAGIVGWDLMRGAGREWIFAALLAGISVLAVLAGILLLKGSADGHWLSRIIQWLQVPMFSIHFRYHCFLLFSLALTKEWGGDFYLRWFYGAHLLAVPGSGQILFIGINFVPLIVLLLLAGTQPAERGL